MFKTKIKPILIEEPPPAYSPRDNLEQKLISSLQSEIASLKSENAKVKLENFNLNKEIDKAYAKNNHLSSINTNKSSEYNIMLAKCEILRKELETKTDRVKELEERIYELIHTISNKNKEIEELKLTLGIKNNSVDDDVDDSVSDSYGDN